VNLVAVVGSGAISPLGPAWSEVMSHISNRLSWVDPSFVLQVLAMLMSSQPLIFTPLYRITQYNRRCFIA
jgi:hypothetical protein